MQCAVPAVDQRPDRRGNAADLRADLELGYTESIGDSGIIAQVGYGPLIDPTTQAGFTWFKAAYNVQSGNNDEYQTSFTAPAPGFYGYVSRFTIDGVNWTYGDLDGAGSNAGLSFFVGQMGLMVVSSPHSPITRW